MTNATSELFSRFRELSVTSPRDEETIRSAIAEGKTAAEGRNVPMCGGPMKRWYCLESDGLESVFKALLSSDTIIVQVGQKLYPLEAKSFMGVYC